MTDDREQPQASDQSSWRLLARIWRDYVRHHKGKIVLSMLCMVVVASMTGAQAQLVAPALDRLLVAGEAAVLWLLPLAFIAAILAKAVASYGQAVLMQSVALRVVEKSRAGCSAV